MNKKYAMYLTISISVLITSILYMPITSFRQPTGSYGLGMKTYHWIDATRKETNDEKQQGNREFMVYVYYPTDQKIAAPTKPYDADALESAKEFAHAKIKIPTSLLKGWDWLKTYAQDNVSMSLNRTQYPVIIVPHGGGTMIQHYTWMLEELASHGYIVVGINHPYMAAATRFPDGRIIKTMALQSKDKKVINAWKDEQVATCVADIEFVIAQLKKLNAAQDSFLGGKLDLANLGVAGHSFGGHLALIVGSRNPEIKAVVDMDGGQRAFSYILGKPYTTPCLVVLAEKSHLWRGEQGLQDKKSLNSFCKDNKDYVTQIIIDNVGHGVFTDISIIMNSILFTRLVSPFVDLDLEASSAQVVQSLNKTASYLVNFFDEHLKTNDRHQVI